MRPAGPRVAAELFKLLRDESLICARIVEATGFDKVTVRTWCDELVAQGILVRTVGTAANNHPARAYRLSPQWGGVAP
jgi:DNA-binding IclR family transcriptional regulator